ncbi:DUF4440 domain-containing protein [Clostridium cellulovorans]|uniref:DUF4440 domain-containing protein n=1 Tax=Clostridium cellulovorans (strain ATCC 35296 / DSM 3052 / OCM 3 / 743B) TaxID=573061 RepID=D9SQZ0_CLOC7|nr:DUF4440 domain-containing protein [Clostridium cellulovorans]ADL50278.1 hypothetical protein Clocel_0503 [Clostridium cellulovorans 743B]
MNSIKEVIFQLENQLLKSEVRKSSKRINEILTNNFVEFTSSGTEYHYKNGDIFQDQNDTDSLNWQIINFEIKELSEDCVLALYKVIKHDEIDENKKYSLRSSVWKCSDGIWKMVFHQGTLSSKHEINITGG